MILVDTSVWLACEEVGVQPDLKAIAHGDFRRCRGSLYLDVWRARGVEA